MGMYPFGRTISTFVDDRCFRLGSQQDGAFKPGNTTLRNPTVQPDVSYLSHLYHTC
jgi:hypothetical protein